MIKKNIANNIFRISFILFLILNIAELRLPSEFDLIPFINFSEIPFFKYIILFLFALFIIPLKEYLLMLKDKRLLIIYTLLILLLCVGYISAFFSKNLETGLRVCSRMTFYFLIFTICNAAVRYFYDISGFIIKSYVYANVIVIIGSLLDFYIPQFHEILIKYFNRPEAIHSYIQIGSEKIMRPMGFITDSNLTAFSIALALLLLIINNNHFNRIFSYIFYITGSYVFGMLTSRGSLVICIISIIIFFAYRIVERKELMIFTIFFIVFHMITPQTYGRILSFYEKEKIVEEFSVGRPVLWKAAFTAFKENPAIGIGPGVFFVVSQEYIRNILKENPNLNITNPELPNYHKIDKLNPHSIFLVMLSETGLIGFAVFLILIIYITAGYFNNNNISLLMFMNILFVSSLSNFAPYYKYYLVISILFFLYSGFNMKIKIQN